MKQEIARYSYPLKLDLKFKKPLQDIAKANRRKINDEINLAVEMYVKLQKEKAK
jgi:hypothetical protein